MPEISGIEFLKSLSNPPMVIFTTAYREFAAEGFDLNAIDYLLKPFSLDRFLLSINKAIDFSEFKNKENIYSENIGRYLFIKDGAKLFQIETKEILYIEAFREYIKIVTSLNKTYVVHQSMKNVEEKLSNSHFIRIHKSYIVAINKITSIASNKVIIQNYSLPISRQLKKEVLNRIMKDKVVIRNNFLPIKRHGR
jgi:DNA-binding LytR/AlgR family response regulator